MDISLVKMFCKLLLLMVFVSLNQHKVFSATTSNSQDNHDDELESEIILELIKATLEAINNISTNILRPVKAVLAKLHDAAEPVKELIRSALSRSITDINDALVAYMEELKKNHTDIDGLLDCVLEQDDNLTLLFNSALNVTMQCAKDQFEVYSEDIIKVLDDFLILNSNLTAIEEALPDCEDSTVTCLKEFLVKLEEILKSLEPIFLNDLGNALEFTIGILDNFKKCGNLGYDVMDEGGYKIYQKVVQCAEGRVNTAKVS